MGHQYTWQKRRCGPKAAARLVQPGHVVALKVTRAGRPVLLAPRAAAMVDGWLVGLVDFCFLIRSGLNMCVSV